MIFRLLAQYFTTFLRKRRGNNLRAAVILAVVLVCGAVGFTYFEREVGEATFVDGLWYSLVTMSTVRRDARSGEHRRCRVCGHFCRDPKDSASDNLNLAITLAIESRASKVISAVECIDPGMEDLLRKAKCDRIVCLS